MSSVGREKFMRTLMQLLPKNIDGEDRRGEASIEATLRHSCGASVISQAYPYLVHREYDPHDNSGGNLAPSDAGGVR